jgi:hypothetical protein
MLGGLGVADAAGVDCCAARDAQVRVRRAQSKRRVCIEAPYGKEKVPTILAPFLWGRLQ